MKRKNDAEVKFKVELDGKNANSDLDNLNKKGSTADNKLSKIGSVGKTAFKAIAVGVGVATTAIGGLIAKSVFLAGELEQQIGGTEAVFKKYASEVQAMSKKAFSSAGLSANTYMATINKMGALMQGSGIDIKTSMDLSSQAMQRAADVASIMGIDVESAMESIAGAAKGNFTMMDNLGVAMNATTIEAYALSKGINKSYDSMTNAEKVQMAMEMFLEKSTYAMGNYTKENETFAGSLQTTKASIENFLSGAGDIEDVIKSVTKFSKILIKKIQEIAPKIIDALIKSLPQLLELGAKMIGALLTGISQNSVEIIPIIMDTIFLLVDTIIAMLPELLNVGIQIIMSFINGLSSKLPDIIALIIDVLLQMVDTILNNYDLFSDSGISLIMGLADGLMEALPGLIDKIPFIIDKLIMAITDNLPKMIGMGIMLILKLGVGLIKAIPSLIKAIPQIIFSLVKGIANYHSQMINKGKELLDKIKEGIVEGIKKIPQIGKNLVQGLWNGIKGAKDWVLEKIKGFGKSILNGIKDIFGIHSPSKVTTKINKSYDSWKVKEEKSKLPEKIKKADEILQKTFNYDNMLIPNNATIEKVFVISGKGTNSSIRDIKRLVAIYGGDNQEWEKVSGKIKGKFYEYEIHWYEKQGIQYDIKSKGYPKEIDKKKKKGEKL